MSARAFLTLQPDGDWIISQEDTEENPIVPTPNLPYVKIDTDLDSLASATMLKYHVRDLPPFVQNHLAVSPRWVTMSLDDFEVYLTLN